ncbi:MAG: electron transfer flavoprotein subunit alpha/FixB family protein [Arthrobacter sp.]
MGTVLVYAETARDGAPKASSGELVTAASAIGTAVAVRVEGGPSARAAALAAAVRSHDAVAVLLPHTAGGRETAGRLAVRLGAAVLTDVVALETREGLVIAKHSVFGGNYAVTATGDGPVVVTVREGALEAAPAPKVLVLDAPADARADATVESVVPLANGSSRPELRSAKIVVAGGRGLGSKEGFGAVEMLADALGAAVGASRAAVDAGYAAPALQVGQTGASVSPDIYIALGISGAIQHRAGMQTAKTIIAVDEDASAPLFEIADLGVVGNVFDVVPQILDALKTP